MFVESLILPYFSSSTFSFASSNNLPFWENSPCHSLYTQQHPRVPQHKTVLCSFSIFPCCTRVWTQGLELYHLNHNSNPFFLQSIISCWVSCFRLGPVSDDNPPISASPLAGITGVSQHIQLGFLRYTLTNFFAWASLEQRSCYLYFLSSWDYNHETLSVVQQLFEEGLGLKAICWTGHGGNPITKFYHYSSPPKGLWLG
jgi:hypothetical protein